MKKYGNAEIKAMGHGANLSGKIAQLAWPAFKSELEQGRFDFSSLKDSEVVAALRRGFLSQVEERKTNLGLNIGKVSKDELARLSVWDLKHLYQLFYLDNFGLFLGFPDELMPEAPDEFSWPVCVPGIISSEIAFRGVKFNLPPWKWTDKPLDQVLDLERGRDAWMQSFIVRARPNWEADEDLKNLSANDIEKQGINILMFRERWILGSFLYWLTGDHLDRQTVTLTGSRALVGSVPRVFFDSGDGRVGVGSFPPDFSHDYLRARQAVSL